MRGVVAAVCAAALLPLVATVVSTVPAVAALGAVERSAAGPPLKKVTRAYGDGPVRLAARQEGIIAFRARRGDHVTLQVRGADRAHRGVGCEGSVSLTDGRGVRTAQALSRVFVVRSSGATTLRFRGRCELVAPVPVRLQLVKVRMKRVLSEGARVRVAAPRRGYLDVAFVRVARDGRDSLVLRDPDGSTQFSYDSQVLVGSRLVDSGTDRGVVTVEAGRRPTLGVTYSTAGPRRSAGEVVGLVATSAGHAEVLRALEYRVELDDPALTLAADPGREHVILYHATAADRAYVIPDGPTWSTWSERAGGADLDDPSLHRTIIGSDPDGADPQSFRVRVRRTLRAPDLVVGGPSVTFASADPGSRFVATIPSSSAGTVRLTASDVAVAGGSWSTDVPPTVCPRDCSWTGLNVGTDRLVADGGLWSERPHELTFIFAPEASGSVTLTLTDIP